MTSFRRLLPILLLSPLLGACALLQGPPREPIPTRLLPAPAPGSERQLVIVLPGRGDDLDGLLASGIAPAIQRAAPQVDVLLAGAGLPYYLDGGLVRRLHEQLVQPARAQGYRSIWMAGASMGGMGTLLYEREHPGALDGLVLMAPFLGERALIAEIEAAGSLAAWQPGPVPAAVDGDNFAREVWRMARDWPQSPQRASRVWLLCGSRDRLLPAARLLATAIPRHHYLERDGGHQWVVWAPAAAEVFARIETARRP